METIALGNFGEVGSMLIIRFTGVPRGIGPTCTGKGPMVIFASGMVRTARPFTKQFATQPMTKVRTARRMKKARENPGSVGFHFIPSHSAMNAVKATGQNELVARNTA